MLKKLSILSVLMVLLLLVFSSFPVAASGPVNYEREITVTSDGGRYQVGFVNIEFKKEFISADMLPQTFTVSLTVNEDGVGINLNPSVGKFCKQVHVRVSAYNGVLFDEVSGSNVPVKVKKQQILLRHFSRHAFS